jgi:hypothetical protein
MNQEPIFAELVGSETERSPEPCKWPYFLVAYWLRGKRWKIHPETWDSPDCPGINNSKERLRQMGWSHITTVRLPESIWKKT